MAHANRAIAIVHREPLIRVALDNLVRQVLRDMAVRQFPTMQDFYSCPAPSPIALIILEDGCQSDARSDIPEIRLRVTDARLILIASHLSRYRVITRMVDGASGYIAQDMDAGTIATAISTVWDGGTYIPVLPPPDPAMLIAEAAPIVDDRLTTRQRQVMALMRLGKSNKEIARDLSISDATVKVHVAAIFHTLHVRNRLSAIMQTQHPASTNFDARPNIR